MILLGSIILSGAVSATGVSISPQSKLFHENISNLQSQSNLSHNNNKINFQSNTIKPTENGNFIIGKLIIPRLGVDCSIRSDTVNAYNSAYHYPQSASFGQHGECGIMSHRTTYSALFRHLDSLRIGDKVIIINLKKTKYTYSVTSNGKDIRWDYKTNPITFTQSGKAKLLLVTCYPPGYEKAAFITHCKLISADHIPRVISTTPNNLKINMSRTSTIAIKLSENIKKSTYFSNIKVKNLKTNKFVTISKNISRNKIYIKTNSKNLQIHGIK